MTCPSCHQPFPEGAQQCPSCGVPLGALAVGTRLQGYRLERPLHRNGGLNYLATHERTRAQVTVLEFFPPEARRFGMLVLLTEPRKRQLAAWLKRAQTWGQWPDPFVCRPSEVFERNATGYAVVAGPAGRTLEAQVKAAGPLSGEEVIQTVEQLVKSAAGMLEAGLPFGELDPSRLSLAGNQQWLNLGWADGGQEAYRPPEAWTGQTTQTFPGLLYSIGACAHFALTGHVPPVATHRALGLPLAPLPVGLPLGLQGFLEHALLLGAQERPTQLSEVRALLRPQPSSAVTRQAKAHGMRVTAHRSWVTHIAMSRQVLVSAGADQQVKVWTLTGEPVGTLDGLRAAPVGLRLLPGGIVAADVRGRVHCWAGSTYHAADSGGGIDGLCVLGGDRVVTLSDRQQLHLWTVPEVQPLGQDAQAGRQVVTLQEGNDGSLVLGTRNGEVLRYEPQQMRRVLLGSVPGPVTHLVVGSEGRTFAACGSTVHLVGTGVIATFPIAVQALALGGEAETLFVAVGRSLYRLDSLGETPQPLLESMAPIRCLSATASHVAIGLEDGQIQVLRLQEEGRPPAI